jgi:outer membrane receptor protein involved in Fe transport
MLNKVLLLLITTTSFLLAGTVGKIAGQVVDATTGEPLIGVNVIVEGTDLGAATDMDGTFVILNLRPGTYDVTFSYIGYATKRVTGVRINVDFTTRVDMELSEAVVELGEVVEVVAEREIIRKDQTGSLSTINDETIRELPVDNVDDILQLKAGITRGADGAFHLRGGRSAEISYMVDGVSASDAFDGSQAYEVEKDAVSELQVISGTFNAEYGQAMSGIINIVTKDGSDNYDGQVTMFSGSFLTDNSLTYYNNNEFRPATMPNIQGNVSGPIIRNNLYFFVSARYQENDNYFWGERLYYPDGSEADGSNVTMNWRKKFFGQAKLTWRVNPTMKLAYNFIMDYDNWRDFEHDYKLSPDGRLKRYEHGYNHSVNFTHTLSNTTFYNASASFFIKDYRHRAYDDVVGWTSPANPGYINPLDLEEFIPSTDYSFRRGGTDNQRFWRKTETLIGKFDINHQLNINHLLKSGVEFRYYTINYEDISIYERNNVFPFDPSRIEAGNPANHESEYDRENDINYTRYTRNPYEFSFYLQDKMEYGDFVFNAGLRMDLFDPNAQLPKDEFYPDIYRWKREILRDTSLVNDADRAAFYKDASVKYQFSPRLGVAYSVTENSKLHFSYGRFLKMPPMEQLFNNALYRIVPVNKFDNLAGNPDLEPEKTTAYEVGYSTRLTPLMSMTATVFYRDIRDYVGTSERPIYWGNNAANGYGYYYYTNLDYANIRGVTLELSRAFANSFAFTVDYTYQVAEGTSSNPGEYFSANLSSEEINRFIFPLNWDQRHTLNGTFYYDFQGWGFSFIGQASTGQPYTPSFAVGNATGLSSIPRYFPKNRGNKPGRFNLDFNVRKTFALTDYTNLTVFLRVFNLLNTENEINVYEDSGRATYSTRANIQRANEIESGIDQDPNYIRWGEFDDYMADPGRFSAPRQFQFGVTYEF